MQPEAKGTVISNKIITDRIAAVAAKDGITAVRIKSTRMLLAHGFLSSVFGVFERYKTSIDMITTSEVAVSVTVDDTKNLDAIIIDLKRFCSVEVDKDQTIVCVVGNFALEKPGYASRIMDAMKTIPISMISYGGSENNISVLIKTTHKKDALMALNRGLFGL
jgi:aspartate kinase